MTSASNDSHNGEKKTVLLVDDESAITLLYEIELARIGYAVRVAHSSAEAKCVSAECQGSIDVLVTDWRMPDQNGDKLACDLLAQRPNLKVVLMSGYPEAEAIARAFSRRQLAFLHKPFSPFKLDEIIRSLLNHSAETEKVVA